MDRCRYIDEDTDRQTRTRGRCSATPLLGGKHGIVRIISFPQRITTRVPKMEWGSAVNTHARTQLSRPLLPVVWYLVGDNVDGVVLVFVRRSTAITRRWFDGAWHAVKDGFRCRVPGGRESATCYGWAELGDALRTYSELLLSTLGAVWVELTLTMAISSVSTYQMDTCCFGRARINRQHGYYSKYLDVCIHAFRHTSRVSSVIARCLTFQSNILEM